MSVGGVTKAKKKKSAFHPIYGIKCPETDIMCKFMDPLRRYNQTMTNDAF